MSGEPHLRHQREPSIRAFASIQMVCARSPIADSPLAREAASVPRGAIGTVDDVDESNGVVFVDFGHGSIACEPGELQVIDGVVGFER